VILKKHLKLFRKFLGNLVRPRPGVKNKGVAVAKFFYLLVVWVVEAVGDVLSIWKRRRSSLPVPRRILIVKTDLLGDVLFSTFLLPIIKRKYPQAEIDYLVNPKAKPVLEGNPHVAHTYFWENGLLEFLPGRGRVTGLRKAAKRNRETARLLKERRYDAILNARAYPPSSNLPLKRLGAALIAFDISDQSFLADYWADYDLEEEEWKNHLNLLVPLGIDVSQADFQEEFYNHGGANPMTGVGKYAVFSPVSFDRERRWIERRWRELICFVVSRGVAVALTGMPSQKKYLEELASGGGEAARVCAEMQLAEFGALMKEAAFFVGIDSFPAHLALAFGKPAFLLVNSKVYYLKCRSPRKFAVDARSLVPLLRNVTFLDATTATSREVAGALARTL
jgi:heptosyltransferase-1